MRTRKLLSSYHPWLYALRIWQRRLFKHIQRLFSSRRYATQNASAAPLPFRHMKHTSKLIRRLGDSDIALQHSKVVNLRIAVDALNGAIIKPGEYFSFCKLVGPPTRKRGFVEGMELSQGKAQRGIGGGICQISNLIHWMALHSPLQVIERSNHSFDPFPDDGRVLPFGSGAAIFYNFIDLVLYNPTQTPFQILLHVGKRQLEGELRCSEERQVKYHVYEKEHRFCKKDGRVYRENQIWRDVTSKGHNPTTLDSHCLYTNCVQVMYDVSDAMLEAEKKI